ncbi:SLATT domain-containing protein [Trinickia acidisoli]|uniref:SLATT domain-containing protein n=1 Tax=Trinickia acidisoli TaxID=2767482 RepID=UPI001A8CE425|nr:SLATT domain-containing protein [Trinickia acidisoli]
MSDPLPANQNTISALSREAKRLEEDATYSSKGHFNAEDSWMLRNYWLGVPATILAALAGATLFKSYPELASLSALAASLLTGLMTFLKPNERAAMHRAAAGQFLSLRNQARFFREIELLQTDGLDELRDRLKALSTMRNELNDKSPSIPRWAFVAARKGIEEGEATHKVDKED